MGILGREVGECFKVTGEKHEGALGALHSKSTIHHRYVVQDILCSDPKV